MGDQPGVIRSPRRWCALLLGQERRTIQRPKTRYPEYKRHTRIPLLLLLFCFSAQQTSPQDFSNIEILALKQRQYSVSHMRTQDRLWFRNDQIDYSLTRGVTYSACLESPQNLLLFRWRCRTEGAAGVHRKCSGSGYINSHSWLAVVGDIGKAERYYGLVGLQTGVYDRCIASCMTSSAYCSEACCTPGFAGSV